MGRIVREDIGKKLLRHLSSVCIRPAKAAKTGFERLSEKRLIELWLNLIEQVLFDALRQLHVDERSSHPVDLEQAAMTAREDAAPDSHGTIRSQIAGGHFERDGSGYSYQRKDRFR